jgi:hypothetical protein
MSWLYLLVQGLLAVRFAHNDIGLCRLIPTRSDSRAGTSLTVTGFVIVAHDRPEHMRNALLDFVRNERV